MSTAGIGTALRKVRVFWDAIEVGGEVVHPALGRGVITDKSDRSIAREGYVAENNHKVSESLARDVDQALNATA